MELPEKAVRVNLKAGKRYSICSCGHSKTMPYCDHSHREINEEKGTSYKSVKIYTETDIAVSFYGANWDKPV